MVSVRFTICFLGFLLAVQAHPFPCDYDYFSDVDGWIKIHHDGSSWDQANRICRLEGAELAAPTTDAMRDAMLSMMLMNVGNNIIPVIHTSARPTEAIQNINEFFEAEVLGLTMDGEYRKVSSSEFLPFICYRKEERTVKFTECGTVDKEYVLDNRTHHCYKFHRIRNSWFEASLTCMIEGGTLAIINSEVEAQVIRDIFAKNPEDEIPGDIWTDSAFLGFWTNEHRKWMTVQGQPLSICGYEGWSEGEPNNANGDEFCGSVGRNGKLFDDPCNRALPFICERKTSSSCGKPKQIYQASQKETTDTPLNKVAAIRRIIFGNS